MTIKNSNRTLIVLIITALIVPALGACSREEAQAVMYSATVDGEAFQAESPEVTCTSADANGSQYVDISVGDPSKGPSISALINPDGNFVEDITIADNNSYTFNYSPYRDVGFASAGESDGTYSIKGEGQLTTFGEQPDQLDEKIVPFELELSCPE